MNTRLINPFPGLRPFETEEYRLFFGREGQSDELLARLQRSRFLAVVGTSGSGKSSLIRAGLMPALLGGMMKGAGSGWRIAVMRPGGDPIGNLAAELVKKGLLSETGEGLSELEAEAVVDATLRRGSLGIVTVARQGRLAPHEKLLVVVDQFEELFRFGEGTSLDEAAAFVKLLLEASQQRELAIYVVLTMRSDFLGDCAQFQGLPEAINDGQYLIPRLTRDERRFAVTGPVGVTRGKITEPLVNRLLNDVGDNPDQLPILQHALMRTWDHWQTHRRNGEPIGLEHYEAIGTMSEALSRHAEEAFNELRDERSRKIAEILFKALTERGADNRDIRRPTRLGIIRKIADASMDEVIAVIDVFRGGGRSFLMPPVGTELHEESVIDISHESLIRNWERLKKWVDEEAQSARIYRRLAEAAVLYREGTEAPLQDPALQFALDWREKSHPNEAWGQRYHPEFETAIDYLDKSRIAREERNAAEEARRNEEAERDKRELEQTKRFVAQQARTARRMRWLIVALCAMLLLSLATAVYAFNQRSKALASQEVAFSAVKAAVNAQTIAEKQEEIAKVRAREAVEAQKAMYIEQEKAKNAAELANEQKSIAEKNLKAAQIATQRANAATDEAKKRAEELEGSLIRSGFMRVGLESWQREDFTSARNSFQALQQQLESLQPAAAARDRFTMEQSYQLIHDYGWALSRLADAQRQLREYEDSVENYEHAARIVAGIVKDPDNPPRILFDTYRGLADAYHQNAILRSVAVNPARSRLTLTPEQQFSKAELLYKKLAEYYDQNKSKKPGDAATSLRNLAQFYTDTARFEEAEQQLKSVIQIYKTGDLPSQEMLRAIKELAEFYRKRERYQDAARTYNELIDLQEGPLYDSIDEEGVRKLASDYGELAQVYSALKDKVRSDATLQLADKTQQILLKVRHIQSLSPDMENADIPMSLPDEFDQMGDIYIKLGRLAEAKRSYEISLAFRKMIKSDHDSRAKSYLKLATLYKEYFKDYKNAELQYADLLTVLENSKEPLKVEDNSLSAYMEGSTQLAYLYAEHLNKPGEAEEVLNSALITLRTQKAAVVWDNEEKLYQALLEVYQKQNKTPEEVQSLRVKKMLTMIERREAFGLNYSIDFIVKYIKTAGEVADYYLHQSDKKSAAAVYARAFDNLPTRNLRLLNPKDLDTYATTLEKYQSVLRDLNKPAKAALFDRSVKAARLRQKRLEDIEKEAELPGPDAAAPPKP